MSCQLCHLHNENYTWCINLVASTGSISIPHLAGRSHCRNYEYAWVIIYFYAQMPLNCVWQDRWTYSQSISCCVMSITTVFQFMCKNMSTSFAMQSCYSIAKFCWILFTFCLFFLRIIRSNKSNYKHISHLTNRFSSTEFQRLNHRKNALFNTIKTEH